MIYKRERTSKVQQREGEREKGRIKWVYERKKRERVKTYFYASANERWLIRVSNVIYRRARAPYLLSEIASVRRQVFIVRELLLLLVLGL